MRKYAIPCSLIALSAISYCVYLYYKIPDELQPMGTDTEVLIAQIGLYSAIISLVAAILSVVAVLLSFFKK